MSPTSVQTNMRTVTRHGFSSLCLPILASNAEQGMALEHVLTRNCAILAMYIGFTYTVDSGRWVSADHALPVPTPLSPRLSDHSPMKRLQEHMAAAQSICEDDWGRVENSR